jgi:hypothetical protein
MVTLTLSVVDGHVDTVDSCKWDGHNGAVRLLSNVGVPMVILTLSVVDGLVDTVDSRFRFMWWLQ